MWSQKNAKNSKVRHDYRKMPKLKRFIVTENCQKFKSHRKWPKLKDLLSQKNIAKNSKGTWSKKMAKLPFNNTLFWENRALTLMCHHFTLFFVPFLRSLAYSHLFCGSGNIMPTCGCWLCCLAFSFIIFCFCTIQLSCWFVLFHYYFIVKNELIINKKNVKSLVSVTYSRSSFLNFC